MGSKGDTFFLKNKKSKDNNKLQNDKPKPSSEGRQNDFDKNRPIKTSQEDTDKKPFDKKAYRLKKYSKKYKLEQWEEKRKKKLLYEYHKSIKDDSTFGSYKPKSFDEDTPDSYVKDVGKFVRHPDLLDKDNEGQSKVKGKRDPYKKAKEHLEKLKQEKNLKNQEKENARMLREQALQEYKKKKQERFKKLSKKTKRGQPMMTGRLELLLEKIQKS